MHSIQKRLLLLFELVFDLPNPFLLLDCNSSFFIFKEMSSMHLSEVTYVQSLAYASEVKAFFNKKKHFSVKSGHIFYIFGLN